MKLALITGCRLALSLFSGKREGYLLCTSCHMRGSQKVRFPVFFFYMTGGKW
jgi:hypothetical protein